MAEQRCSEMVPDDTGFHFGNCSRKGVVHRNGKWFCWQHDPEAVKARAQKSREQYDQKQQDRKARTSAAVLRDPRVVALRGACEGLVNEHRLFVRGPEWVCPFCAAASLSALDFSHTDTCPVHAARAALAATEAPQ